MADATANLPAFDDPAQWTVRPAIAVFDEHEERDAAGKLLRRFGRRELEQIADRCNRRDAIGSLCPLTLGHTREDVPESEQPPIVGYARKFRVEHDSRLGKLVIKADYYLKTTDLAEAEKYPRTSVEYWPADGFFDPISLLKRTPQRDLGQWTYCARGQRIRYSMEDKPVSQDQVPTAPGAAGEAITPDHPVWKYMCQKYAAETTPAPAMPGPGNVTMPAAVKPEDEDKEKAAEVARMGKDQDAIRYARQESELAALKAEVAAQKLLYQRSSRERDLVQLEAEGYQFDRADELATVEGMSAEQYAKHVARVRKLYRKAPLGGFIQTADLDDAGQTPASKELGEEDSKKVRYHAAAKKISYAAARAELYPGK